MTKLAIEEKTILFMNDMAGDDLWDYGHLLVAGRSQSSPPHELFNYKRGSTANNNSAGVYLTTISVNGVQLYGFPFLPFEVDPFDVEYPSPINGIVITQDMRMLDYFFEQDPNFYHVADRRTSRLAWAKKQGLPCVLAVHHANGHKGNLMSLTRLVGMEIFCPVIWHNSEPTKKFFHKAIESLVDSY
jgi:hypothetical protein